MRSPAPALVALPAALLLALSLSACDEEAITAPTASSSSSSSGGDASPEASPDGDTQDPKEPSESPDSKDSGDDASATPSSKAEASSSAPADSNATTVGINDLKTGDCISEMITGSKDGEKGATDAKVVDCTAPHKYEVVGEGKTTAATHSEASTPEEISTVCQPVITTYVGSAEKASEYRIAALTPSRANWDQGSRSLTCFLQAPDDKPLNKSARNS